MQPTLRLIQPFSVSNNLFLLILSSDKLLSNLDAALDPQFLISVVFVDCIYAFNFVLVTH